MRLAVTREQSKLQDLIDEARARRIELVPLPLTTVIPVPFDWPAIQTRQRIDWLAFTSANGVQCFFEVLEQQHGRIDSSTKIAVVGGKTAQAVLREGYDISFVPSTSYGEVLFSELAAEHLTKGNALVYARAEEVNFDPSTLLAQLGVMYYPVVCYRTIESDVKSDTIDILGSDDRILFTAPSNVIAYHNQFGIPKARVIAIGNTTAREMERLGWRDITIMTEADVSRVWEFV